MKIPRKKTWDERFTAAIERSWKEGAVRCFSKDDIKAADKWEKTQVAEIAAFKKTLDVLLNRSYGTLPNKLNYMDIG